MVNNKRKLTLANNPLLAGPAFGDRQKTGVPYREVAISLIDADPNQPRRHFDPERLNELCSSIKTYGVLSPILVRPSVSSGRFTLIAGERRFRASQLAGLTSIPVIVDQSDDSSNERTMAMQLVENLQRADLSSLERAHAIGALRDAHALSVRDIAERLGVSKSMVQRSLEILELPDDLLNALREGAAESKVLLLSKIADAEIRASYLKDLDTLTRSQIQKNIETTSDEPDSKSNLTPEDIRITDELQRALGLKVKMTKSVSSSEAGKLTIEFYSASDLQEICRKLIAEQ